MILMLISPADIYAAMLSLPAATHARVLFMLALLMFAYFDVARMLDAAMMRRCAYAMPRALRYATRHLCALPLIDAAIS